MQSIIRKAKPEELPAVLALNARFVPKVSPVDLAWLEKWLQEADLFDVYVEDGKVRAFIIGMGPEADYESENFRWFKAKYDRFLYVDRIAVDAEAQGKGIGRELYAHLERRFAGKVPRITCEVNLKPENPWSYRFHTRLGFEEVGQQDTKGGTIRVALMAKEV